MALKLPDHGHCEHCGDPVPFGERFCSQDCQASFLEETRQEKNKDMRFYAMIAISLIAVFAVALIVRML